MTDKLKVVAYLVSNLPSGEPGLCFEDERGDYGTEDFIPAFEALVRKADLDAALERVKVLEADALRYRWVQTNYSPFDSIDGVPDEMDRAMMTGGKILDNAIDAAIDAASIAGKGTPS